MRVYIHGVDVSPWLKGDVTVSYANREGFNTASINLSNPRGLWLLHERNLLGDWSGKGEFDESAKFEIFKWKNSIEYNTAYNLNITRSIFGSTTAKPVESTQAELSSAFAKNPYFPPSRGEDKKYRLAVNDCIFNKHDYMRIFIKNPLGDYAANEWMEVFCGFVQDHPVTTNYITGESTVRITGSCIKQQLAKMRVSMNPHLAAIDPSPLSTTGFYKDFMFSGGMSHPFAQSSLEATIRTLILGTQLPQQDNATNAIGGVATKEMQSKIGDFKMGNTICYNPTEPGNTLERWHLMTIFGVNKKPFPTGGGNDDLWLTQTEMEAIGKSTRPIINNQICGDPTARYLHFLLPSSGTGAGTLVQAGIVTGAQVTGAREWTTRWDVIRDFASKLDFQVLTSPSGDILVEFPMYGFTPCAFLTNFTSSTTAKILTPEEKAKESKSVPLADTNDPDISQKAWNQCQNVQGTLANIFVFDKHEKEGTLNDEAEDFPTILNVTGGSAFAPTNINTGEVFQPRAVVYSPLLADRYGIIVESVDFPFAGQDPGDQGGDINSPLTRRLAQLGLIEYTKRLAHASTWQGSIVYRPFLFPNRPIELKRSARIGNMTSVSHTWNIPREATTAVSTNMLLSKRISIQNGQTVSDYRLLTGSLNTPLDYGAIWGEATPQGIPVSKETGEEFPEMTPDAGVRVELGDSKKSTGDVNTPDTDIRSVTELLRKDSTLSLNALFPPFARLVVKLIDAAKAAGLKPIITSGYRSPSKQAQIKADREKYPVAAEPYLSMHQYGLAIDITLEGAVGISDRSLGNLQLINNKIGANLKWGGEFPTYDGVHFQIPAGWGMSVAMAKAIVFADKRKNQSEDAIGIQMVWKAIYAKNLTLLEEGDQYTPADFAFDPSRPDSFIVNPNIGVPPMAPPCDNTEYLQTPGLKMK